MKFSDKILLYILSPIISAFCMCAFIVFVACLIRGIAFYSFNDMLIACVSLTSGIILFFCLLFLISCVINSLQKEDERCTNGDAC